MIAVHNLPSMIGNRKTPTPDFPTNEDSFGSQGLSNLSLRDRTKMSLSLNDLEPRMYPVSECNDVSSQPKVLPNEVLISTPTPTQILFPKHVTEEQEAYVRGFSQALEEIYRQHGPPTSSIAKFVEPSQQLLEDKRRCQVSDSYSISSYNQTWFYNDSKSSCFSISQIDQKPTFNQNNEAYEPMALDQFPSMAQNVYSTQTLPSNSNYTSIGSSQMSSTKTTDCDFVVGSLPSSSFSSAGQKRNLSKMASQSLGSLTPSSIGSPCGSDLALHSRSVAGEFTTLDMEEQEKLRLERKRAKNRLAAQKCQQKKVERIKQLESRVTFLREKNSSLSAKASSLRRDIERLKSDINAHVSLGCRILPTSAYNSCDVVPPFT